MPAFYYTSCVIILYSASLVFDDPTDPVEADDDYDGNNSSTKRKSDGRPVAMHKPRTTAAI